MMGQMKPESTAYFETVLFPLIQQKHGDLMDQLSLVALGSVGLGNDDGLSDLEAAVYLPDPLWQAKGFPLQVDLDRCLVETNPWRQAGSIVSVYPLSWLLDGQGEKLLSGGSVNWERLSFDSLHGLFVLHNQPVLHDPQDRLGRLRQATAPDRMPEGEWRRRLLAGLEAFVCDGMQELCRCVDRGHLLDALVPYGDAVKALLELGFLVSRSYYPYRKHLRWAFDRLPPPVAALGPQLDALADAGSWPERISRMEALYRQYRALIQAHALLPELDFTQVDLLEMPLHDQAFDVARQLLRDPAWREKQAARREKTVSLGYPPEASRWTEWWRIC